MTHARTQIREAVKTALTGLSETADRVLTGRSRPLAKGHEPTLLIYTQTEESSRDGNGVPPMLRRSLTLYIEGRVSKSTPPDDLLDNIAEQVEAAMWSNRTLGGLAFNLQYRGFEQRTEAEGDSQIGGIRLEYRLTYRTDEGAASVVV